MSKKEVTELAIYYLHAISEHYGESKFHDTTPHLSIEDSPFDESNEQHDGFGEYSFDYMNELIVYWKNITSEEDLIRTLVHEYTHYLQSPSWYKRYYHMGYGYNTHPYEVSAFKAEEDWAKFLKK